MEFRLRSHYRNSAGQRFQDEHLKSYYLRPILSSAQASVHRSEFFPS